MRTSFLGIILLALAACSDDRGAEPAASGAVETGLKTCDSGKAIVDRQGRRGVITGESNGMCKVQLADGTTSSYLAWMLAAADGSTTVAVDGLAEGEYNCSAPGAGTFKVVIVDDDEYEDREGDDGDYEYDPDTNEIEFESGSLEGQYSKLLAPGKFGIAAEKTTMFYMVCNLRS